MHTNTNSCHGYRFPAEIISQAVWLYHRFCLSFRDVEDLLAERGIVVTRAGSLSPSRLFGSGVGNSAPHTPRRYVVAKVASVTGGFWTRSS